MFRSRSSASAAVVFTLALAAIAGNSDAQTALFEVAGTLEPAPSGLQVRLALRNVGRAEARHLKVFGDLLGTTASSAIVAALPADATAEVRLAFPDAVPVAGVHALVMRLEYDSVATGRADPMNQYAYLLLAFGGATAPAVKLEMPPVRLVDTARALLTLESADGRAHRAQVTVYLPRMLGVAPFRQTVEVPAQGVVHAPLQLFRSLATYETRHGLLAVAVTDDDGAARTAAVTSVIEIGADGAWLPRLRYALLGLVAVLLATAAFGPRRARAAA